MLDRSHSPDPAELQSDADFLIRVRDHVLDGASIEPGDTLLDVGTGDGLIAFGALDRVGPDGHVIFSDISDELLDHCRRAAAERGVTDRSSFLLAPAHDLSGIDDGSIDVVTMRSVLIYVADKEGSFREFFRVLGPGGRLSMFEPINRYFGSRGARMFGFDLSGIEDLVDRVVAVYDRIQPQDTDPMFDFGDRDLIELAERAGFDRIQVELLADVHPMDPITWESFVSVPPNPLVPSVAEAVAQALSDDEAKRFEDHLRPLVEAAAGTERYARVFLRARTPTG